MSGAMTIIKWLLAAALIYGSFVALLYVAQRGMMYLPDTTRTPPAAAGLPQAEEVTLTAADGEKLIAWHVRPGEGRPVILYFQGNGGGLSLRARRFRNLAADGFGLLALAYRGYGGSTGSPSETGLMLDAAAAYAFAADRYGADRIVVWGESLGTGVGVALAAERPVARVLLESPFTSTADIAAASYPIVPVRLLMKDQFRSDERIAKVTAPVLVLHGVRDGIVPISYGQRLYNLIRSPKRFISLPTAGHNDHDDNGAYAMVRPFLASGTLEQ
jgi:fermentation-respiration switch protein FrsA (DUF1100 family)